MKTFLFPPSSRKGGAPFWQPWGCWGCLWRLLLFLLMLLTLLLLLSMLHTCEGQTGSSDPVDSTWNNPVSGGDTLGLPRPEENVPPEFNDSDLVPNPEDTLRQEYRGLLYVIFDEEEMGDNVNQAFATFAQKFYALYPRPAHQIIYYNTGSKTALLRVPEEQRMQLCEQLPVQIPDPKFYVTPVEVMAEQQARPASRYVPGDPAMRSAGQSWQFAPIQAYEAWSVTRGDPSVVIGIVDSYMDLSHEELQGGRAVSPFSVERQSADVSPQRGVEQDSYGHGTLVTATACGNMDNGRGSAGIAPRCRFLPYSLGTTINTFTICEGILYCIHHGASVVNVSLGGVYPRGLAQRMSLGDQIRYSRQSALGAERMWNYVFHLADRHGTTLVLAAGNDALYTGMDAYKRNSTTVRVSAVDRQLRRADFSNLGHFPQQGIDCSTVSAPGVDIYGAFPGGKYVSWPGTSFSAPITTGAVALMKSLNKHLTNREVVQILRETGRPLPASPEIGPLLQIKNALLNVKHGTLARFTTEAARLRGTWETIVPDTIWADPPLGVPPTCKVRVQFLSGSEARVSFVIFGPGQVCGPSVSTQAVPATVQRAGSKLVVKMTAEAAVGGSAQTSLAKHTFTLSAGEGGRMYGEWVPQAGGTPGRSYFRKL